VKLIKLASIGRAVVLRRGLCALTVILAKGQLLRDRRAAPKFCCLAGGQLRCWSRQESKESSINELWVPNPRRVGRAVFGTGRTLIGRW
jgi:hypothetical protein